MPANVDLNIDINTDDSGTEKAATGLEFLAKAADNAKDQLSELDRKLAETRAEMALAGKTFQETGDISPLKSLIKDERQLSTVRNSVAKGLNSLETDIEDLGGRSGNGFFTKFKNTLTSGLNGLSSGLAPEGLTQWLVGAAVVAAPIIGAALSAGVLLGVGAGGLAGGLIAIASDPRIKGAFVDLGGTIEDTFAKAANGFIGPALFAIGKIKSEFVQLGPALQKDFDALAPSVIRLGNGLAGFLDKLQNNGLDKAFAAAGPAIDTLSEELPKMGAAMGDFFASIAGGKDGAIQFIHDFFTWVDVTIVALGKMIEFLSNVYEFLRKGPGELLTGFLSFGLDAFEKHSAPAKQSLQELNAEGYATSQTFTSMADIMAKAGLATQLSGESFKSFSAQINATRSDTDALAASMVDKIINTSLSLDRATLGVAESQRTLKDTLEKNIDAHSRYKAATDISTEAGQTNRQAILSAVSANLANYDAMIRAGFGAQDAAQAYHDNETALEGVLRKSHLTQGEIDGLIGKYRDVPSHVDTSIQLQGIQKAIEDLTDVIRAVNKIPTTHDIYVTTHFQNVGTLYTSPDRVVEHQRDGGIVAAAMGAIVSSPTVLFGERSTGQEAFIPKLGISQSRALSIANTAAGWHGGMVVPKRSVAGAGGGAVTIGFDAEPGTLEHAILSMIRATVTNSGGSVQAALGRRGH